MPIASPGIHGWRGTARRGRVAEHPAWALVVRGAPRAVVDSRLPLDDVAAARARPEARHLRGKVVVTTG